MDDIIKQNSNDPEFLAMQSDIEALKKDLAQLASDAKTYGTHKAEEVMSDLKIDLKNVQSKGRRALHDLEEMVVEDPAKSLAIAVASGVALSLLLGRKR